MRGDGRPLYPAPQNVEFAFELLLAEVLAVRDQELLDFRTRGFGLFTQYLRVHRNMAPSVYGVSAAQYFGFHDRPATLLRIEVVAGKKRHADGNPSAGARIMPRPSHLLVEELGRNLNMQTGSVASLSVGINSSPMPDSFQRIDSVLDHFARALSVYGDDKSDAARIMLVFGPIESSGFGILSPLFHFMSPSTKFAAHEAFPLLLRPFLAYRSFIPT